MDDNALDFFTEIFDTIPSGFKHVPKEYTEDNNESQQQLSKNKKKRNKKGGEAMSMVEIKERA